MPSKADAGCVHCPIICELQNRVCDREVVNCWPDLLRGQCKVRANLIANANLKIVNPNSKLNNFLNVKCWSLAQKLNEGRFLPGSRWFRKLSGLVNFCGKGFCLVIKKMIEFMIFCGFEVTF